jgi:hypothetical protein
VLLPGIHFRSSRRFCAIYQCANLDAGLNLSEAFRKVVTTTENFNIPFLAKDYYDMARTGKSTLFVLLIVCLAALGSAFQPHVISRAVKAQRTQTQSRRYAEAPAADRASSSFSSSSSSSSSFPPVMKSTKNALVAGLLAVGLFPVSFLPAPAHAVSAEASQLFAKAEVAITTNEKDYKKLNSDWSSAQKLVVENGKSLAKTGSSLAELEKQMASLELTLSVLVDEDVAALQSIQDEINALKISTGE